MADAGGIAAASAAQSQGNVRQQVQVNLLRDSLDQQQSNIGQLLEGLPQAGSSDPSAGAANPAEDVGSRVNVSA